MTADRRQQRLARLEMAKYDDEKGQYFLETVVNEQRVISSYLNYSRVAFRAMFFVLIMVSYGSSFIANSLSELSLVSRTSISIGAFGVLGGTAFIFVLAWFLTEQQCERRLKGLSEVLLQDQRDRRNPEWLEDYVKFRHFEEETRGKLGDITRYLAFEPIMYLLIVITSGVLTIR